MHRSFVSFLITAAMLAPVAASPFKVLQNGRIGYISYDDAKPLLKALNDTLPAELRSAGPERMPAIWADWVARRNDEIRSRLATGDEDSLINFLLFGTSFTNNPRITLSALAKIAGQPFQASRGSSETQPIFKNLNSRIDDLVRGIATPGANERLLFARRLIEKKGYDPRSASNQGRIKDYLSENLNRMLKEQAAYARLLESARLLGDPSAEFAERSKLYSARGLSSDTSILPNYAIERALVSIKAQGFISPGGVRRVAIIGPGLDFTDKEDGYDFYPQQTIQPFAIVDTLLRAGLATATGLKVTTLDLSPRVNDHLRLARQRARRGSAYTIQLPRDAQGQWKPEALDYWARFGDRIGQAAAPVDVPRGIGELKIRAVRVRPSVVSLITPEDVNIVLQHLRLPNAEAFDLVIATNIFVYYDVFEQSLALTNVKNMLRPGGLLLSNNALLELPASGMHSIGYETVVYSDRPDHGDHIVWYQREIPR
jgi:hypothetical protein